MINDFIADLEKQATYCTAHTRLTENPSFTFINRNESKQKFICQLNIPSAAKQRPQPAHRRN